MSKFFYNNDVDNADDVQAMAIPQVFSENSRAKNPAALFQQGFLPFQGQIPSSEPHLTNYQTTKF